MQLGDVCAVTSGFSARTRLEPDSAGILSLQQGCITANGELDLSAASRIDPTLGSRHHLVHPGDVLFRSRGSATSAWAADDSLREPALALLPLYILRPRSDILDAAYLAWLITRPAAQEHFTRETVGSNIQMIKKPAILSLPLDLPPLSLQRGIAETAHLAAREHALATQLASLRRDLLTLQLDARTSTTPHHDRNTK